MIKPVEKLSWTNYVDWIKLITSIKFIQSSRLDQLYLIKLIWLSINFFWSIGSDQFHPNQVEQFRICQTNLIKPTLLNKIDLIKFITLFLLDHIDKIKSIFSINSIYMAIKLIRICWPDQVLTSKVDSIKLSLVKRSGLYRVFQMKLITTFSSDKVDCIKFIWSNRSISLTRSPTYWSN